MFQGGGHIVLLDLLLYFALICYFLGLCAMVDIDKNSETKGVHTLEHSIGNLLIQNINKGSGVAFIYKLKLSTTKFKNSEKKTFILVFTKL